MPGKLRANSTVDLRKVRLHLDGLGIRDLCVHGDDLLILAGPTMDLDGPVAIFRWLGGANPAGKGLVLREACLRVGAVPFGQDADKGTDHAEGMCLCSADGWGRAPQCWSSMTPRPPAVLRTPKVHSQQISLPCPERDVFATSFMTADGREVPYAISVPVRRVVRDPKSHNDVR
jgi:Protein of unknown function (DUF3616)